MIDIHSRYRQAARERFDTGFEGDMIICESANVEIDSEREGAWVQASLFVPIDALDPEPGPTYDVWIAEQVAGDPAPGGYYRFNGPGSWPWCHAGMTFTCDNDPDGKGARRAAHYYARHLRSTYHCAFVAVRAASKGMPLPIAEGCE